MVRATDLLTCGKRVDVIRGCLRGVMRCFIKEVVRSVLMCAIMGAVRKCQGCN